MSPRKISLVRRITQYVALAFFLVAFIFATLTNPIPGVTDFFYRLDPLAALTAMLAGKVLIATFGLAIITLALTVLFGRVWCGWLCPMGTVLDIFKPAGRRPAGNRRALSPRWRMTKYLLLIFLIVAAVLGNQSLMIFDPITLLTRTMANAFWPALSAAIYGIEKVLYQFDALWPALDAVHRSIVFPLFKDLRPVFGMAVPITLIFIAVLGLNWIAERFWCRYLCPLGGMLGALSRFAPFKRVVDDTCISCNHCSHICPTGTIDPARRYASDPAECSVCYDCVSECPPASTSFKFLPGLQAITGHLYDPSRRDALKVMGASAAWAALAMAEPITKRQPATMVRPPVLDLEKFEQLCIRCNLCVRVCPTQGLQASGLDGGWRNLMTPRLVPRIGYCSYNCAACGTACPTKAIPELTLEEKRHVTIGLARIDRDRCLPWAYNIDCIVCEEACPIPTKAIKLEQAEVINGKGDLVTIQRPYMLKEYCIGCGMCEYQCPMGGEAAIRVYSYTEAGGYLGDGSGDFY